MAQFKERLRIILSKVIEFYLKLSMKWKIFALVATIILLAVLFISPREAGIFKEDKMTFVKDVTSRISRSTARSVLNRMNTYQDKLIIFTSYRESISHTSAKLEDQVGVLFSQEQEFLAVGLLMGDNKYNESVSWVLRNSLNNGTKTWPPDMEKAALLGLDLTPALNSGRALWNVKTADGAHFLVFGLRVEIAPAPGQTGSPLKTWIMGLLSPTAFDDLFSDFSTGVNKAYVVDDTGTAIYSSDPASKFQNLKAQDLFSDALKPNKGGTSKEYTLNGQKVIGSFESIDKTNLVAVVTTPEAHIFDASQNLSRTVYYVGGTLLLISLGITVLFSNILITGPLAQLSQVVMAMTQGEFKNVPQVSNKDEIGAFAATLQGIEGGMHQHREAIEAEKTVSAKQEKIKAFTQFSGGIAQEVKNPLAGVLGHIQLAMKDATTDSKSHLELAEQEIRRCKNIVENLGKLGHVDKPVFQRCNLAQIAQDAINRVDHQLSLAGCKILKDFRPCPMVNVDPQQIQQVLIWLLQNAGQAVESTSEKVVTVRVFEATGKVHLVVEDSGIGIPIERQTKIFEPFFTTKEPGKGLGLSLAVSRSIVEENHGQISFKAGPNNMGTIFLTEFSIPEQRIMPDTPLTNAFGGNAINTPEPQQSQPPKSTKPDEEIVSFETPEGIPETPFAQTLFKPLAPVLSETKTEPVVEEMPPIPEDALFLEKIRPHTIPIPQSGLPTSLPKKPNPPPLEEAAFPTETAPSEEVPTTVVPHPPGYNPPPLRTVPEFKVTIRRPKLRS